MFNVDVKEILAIIFTIGFFINIFLIAAGLGGNLESVFTHVAILEGSILGYYYGSKGEKEE